MVAPYNDIFVLLWDVEGAVPYHCIFNMHRRDDHWSPVFVCNCLSFSGCRGRHPLPNLNNALSARGLGGAHALATARANLVFAPPVYPYAIELYLETCC